jgi:putative ATPase
VAQQYLPGSLQGQVFYQPSDRGYESQVQQQVARHREAQLAAMVEGTGVALPEILTFSPADSATDRWLQRTISQTGERLSMIRDRIFTLANSQRHHLILDVNAGSGLLTWEAVRCVPEGGVFAWVYQSTDASALREQAILLPELRRPEVLQGDFSQLAASKMAKIMAKMKFDRIVGRNVLLNQADKAAVVKVLADCLQPGGVIVLAETITRQTQRLYQLIESDRVGTKLYQKWIKAEEAIYQDSQNPMVNWDAIALATQLQAQGLKVELQIESIQTQLNMTAALLDRWFTSNPDRPSYAEQIAHTLSESEVTQIQNVIISVLKNQIVNWNGAIGFYRITLTEVASENLQRQALLHQ